MPGDKPNTEPLLFLRKKGIRGYLTSRKWTYSSDKSPVIAVPRINNVHSRKEVVLDVAIRDPELESLVKEHLDPLAKQISSINYQSA